MTNFINKVEIRHLKSIRECDIEECKRINLFIGRPNVGKSNIIEALSLFTVPFLLEAVPTALRRGPKLTNLIRLENAPELFYNGDWKQQAFVKTDIGTCTVDYSPKEGLSVFMQLSDSNDLTEFFFDENFGVVGRPKMKDAVPIKKYSFKVDVKFRRGHTKYLIPPFGSNLLYILLEYPDLRQEVEALFKEYGLSLVSDTASHSLKILQSRTNSDLFMLPYNSIADTLQRIIFYKAAIASNENSILLLEEPEAHAFPPYMSHITQEMIHKRSNQYFVATHSPFVLNDLLENAREELAVYMVSWKDKQTAVRKLTDEELYNVYQRGVDIFTNSESFI